MNETSDAGIGAFLDGPPVTRQGAGQGPLAGLTFAAKDLFDVTGSVTGAGSPAWRESHAPAREDAWAVRRLLEAGARLVGKTHTDEMAYSLNGENAHYGTPENVRAPGRIPGGSSSGSAAATAAGLVDLALGSDTGGSVRVPASYCGLFGLRPTHGRIPAEGVWPMAPSFDTVGWFADTGDLFARVGSVLLPEHRTLPLPRRLLVARDAFAQLPDPLARALEPAVERVAAMMAEREDIVLAGDGLETWMPPFRILQGREIWRQHGEWVRTADPAFGPGVAERMQAAATLQDDEVREAAGARERIRARVHQVLTGDVLICLPTAAGIAPRRNLPAAELDAFRQRLLSLTCISGHAGTPQINLPLVNYEDCPLGLSLIAAPGNDEQLLSVAAGL